MSRAKPLLRSGDRSKAVMVGIISSLDVFASHPWTNPRRVSRQPDLGQAVGLAETAIGPNRTADIGSPANRRCGGRLAGWPHEAAIETWPHPRAELLCVRVRPEGDDDLSIDRPP